MDHRDMAGGYPVHCAFGVELRLSPRVGASVPFEFIGGDVCPPGIPPEGLAEARTVTSSALYQTQSPALGPYLDSEDQRGCSN